MPFGKRLVRKGKLRRLQGCYCSKRSAAIRRPLAWAKTDTSAPLSAILVTFNQSRGRFSFRMFNAATVLRIQDILRRGKLSVRYQTKKVLRRGITLSFPALRETA